MSCSEELQSKPVKWKNGISERQSRIIPQETWDQYKSIISEKYFELTLSDLINWMKDKYNFTAT
jgi:Clr5 domain